MTKWPNIFTDRMYIGLRNGKCVAMAREMRNAKENRRTRVEWARDGLDILTIHEGDATPYYDEMRAAVSKDLFDAEAEAAETLQTKETKYDRGYRD